MIYTLQKLFHRQYKSAKDIVDIGTKIQNHLRIKFNFQFSTKTVNPRLVYRGSMYSSKFT